MRTPGEHDLVDDGDALELTEENEGICDENDMEYEEEQEQEQEQEEEEEEDDDTFNEHDGELGDPLDNNSLEASLLDGVNDINKPVFKYKHWDDWLRYTKGDGMKVYKTAVDTQKQKWKSEKNNELENFLLYLEGRWMHFNGNIDKNCKTGFLWSTNRWTDKDWITWFKKDGLKFLDGQFEKWLDYNRKQLSFWVMNEWRKWVSERRLYLDDSVWEARQKSGRLKKWYNYINKKEKDNTNKIKVYIDKWEKKTKNKYKKWKKVFAKTWLESKQWNVWQKDVLHSKKEVETDEDDSGSNHSN
ncbi:tryptophan-rich antigen, putative [Plasmodium malariae]|uniref:Tryptophan-rich antigen, putative n=1 Tax=Plasmodium malariae TaxID=5858 RepID=A0A1A8X4Z5_PLAMA|nr:tryptophan-rich antigen, putative [Plasmodium malariae]